METFKENFVETFGFMAAVLFGVVIFAFCLAVLINPHFWQGLRNSIFLDKLKKEHLGEETDFCILKTRE